MQAQRRVKRLQLTGDCYADVQHATQLIEDALRTASFPGLPKNGLVLIRRLELGKLSMTNNSGIFSQRIDQRLLMLQPRVIQMGQEEQPDAQIVWFADSVEPYILLSRLLAKGAAPLSWYWRLAVREWLPSNNTQADLVALIHAASQTSHGLMCVAGIVDGLVSDGTIDGFIESLSAETANDILQNMHIDPARLLSEESDDERILLKPISLTENWRSALQKWMPAPGEGDSRCCLLAISAAISYDFSTAEMIAAAILHHVAEANASAQRTQKVRQDGNDKKQIDNETNAEGDAKEAAKGVAAEKRNLSEIITLAKERLVDGRSRSGRQQQEIVENETADIQNLSGVLSHNAGLPLLINVLQRLHIHETLVQFPLLAELNLPTHIFWACLQRSGVTPDDVVCQWLTAKHKLPAMSGCCPFVIPESWFNLLFGKHRSQTVVLRNMRGDRDKHLLYDSSGRVVLAIWPGKMPVAVSKLINGRKIKLLAPVEETHDLQLIIGAYLFAVRRYLWRFSKTGLRRVVRRRGRVAMTRTHLDVSFFMWQIDIDIRKAGLDINPGWTPWLGRVVQFHYLEEGD